MTGSLPNIVKILSLVPSVHFNVGCDYPILFGISNRGCRAGDII